MQKTKLAQLLNKLEETEVKAFNKFLASPYFNNSPVIIRYWEQLKKNLSQLDAPSLHAEKLFKKLFPKEEFQEKKLRQIRSRLLKLLEEFLVIEQLKKDNYAYKKRVADVYFEKELKLEFEKRYQLLLKDLKVEDFLTGEQLHRKLSLYHQLYFNHLHTKRDEYPKYLSASTDLLESYYERQKQLYALEWFSHQERYSHAIPTLILQYKKGLHTNGSELTDTLESIYKNMLKLFLVPQEMEKTAYYLCKDQLTKNYYHLGSKEKNIFLKLLINFCITRFKEGKQLDEELFYLYDLGLSDNSIFVNEKITNLTFLSIVINASKLKKIDWARSFVNLEKWRLYEDKKETYLGFAEAAILFYSDNFKDCLKLISNLDYTYFTLMEVVKRELQIRAAFEIYINDSSYKTTILSFILNLEKYLNRKIVLSIRKKEACFQFIKLLKMVIQWNEEKEHLNKLILIKEKIQDATLISSMFRNWLLQHIEKFEKGLSRTTLSK